MARSSEEVLARALIFGAAAGMLLASLVVGADLFSSAPPDDDPMSFPIGVGFLLAVPIGAVSGALCALPAVGVWWATARFATKLRFLAVALTASAGVGFIALWTGELSWDAAGLVSGAAFAAAVFAPTITSRPAAAADDTATGSRGPESSQ